MNKNNLFGINATDSNPGQDANHFNSVEDCIYTHAQRYISWGIQILLMTGVILELMLEIKVAG